MPINSISRNSSNPFDVYEDVKTHIKFIFRRQDIVNFVAEVRNDIELLNRLGASDLENASFACSTVSSRQQTTLVPAALQMADVAG